MPCGHKVSNEFAVQNSPEKHIYVFHENLHDNAGVEMNRIFKLLGLNCSKDSLGLRIENETSHAKFGRRSIEISLQKLLPGQIKEVLIPKALIKELENNID